MKDKGKEAADISRYFSKILSFAKIRTHIYMKLYLITCSL